MLNVMEMNGDIEKVDIMMYQGIADMANNKLQKLDEELIPTFIVEESLNYFCSLEKYEVCQKIQTFFNNNSSYVIPSTRAEWYGVDVKKKQNY